MPMSSNTETASAPPSPPADINTGGGASVGGDVHAGRDFVGRDQYIINIIQAKQGQAASRSFGVLAESMHQPAVRDAAMAFQTIFRDANDHIDVVHQHKQMHDQLHWLQVQFYDVVRHQEARFGGDEGAQATVEGAESVLRSAIENLRNVARQARMGEMDVVWIDELDLALVTLHEAIAVVDAKLLRRAILGVGQGAVGSADAGE